MKAKPAATQPLKISAAISRRIEKLAREANTTPQRMLGFVLRDGLEYNDYAVKAINEGLADIEAGRIVSHDEVLANSEIRLAAMPESPTLPAVTLAEVSRGYPIQAQGTVGDRAFYLRDRDGLEIRIGTPDPESPIGIKEREPFWWFPDGVDEYSDEEIVHHVRRAFGAYTKHKARYSRKKRKPSNDAG